MYDIIIVGAGPAGLSSALYALRANKSVLILEEKTYGGQIINASKVENYPGLKEISGFDLATNLYNQVIGLGAKYINEAVIHIEPNKVFTKNNCYEAKAIILAPGVKPRKLNLDNEEKLIGKGISYCATCDGNFYKEKNVMVVGGGNTALEDAIYLSHIASKVYLVHRKNYFTGEDIYIKEIKEIYNIEVIFNTTVTEIIGNDKVTGVKTSNGDEIEIDGLFVAIGQIPNNDIFKNVVDLDEHGYIISDGVKTKIDSIFVAGDARQKMLRQFTTAICDGALAATLAIKKI